MKWGETLFVNSLQGMLEELRQAGVDSEGQFTLNPARARELLEQFQLPDVAHYLLHLCSFLVGAGARAIHLEPKRSGLLLEAPGAKIDEQSLRSPFSVLLKSSAEPQLGELAIGLNSFLSLDKAVVKMSYQSLSGTYKRDAIEVDDLSNEVSDLSIMLQPRIPKERDIQMLAHHFRFAPIAIKSKGITLNPAFDRNDVAFEFHIKNDDYPLPEQKSDVNRLCKENRAKFSALLEFTQGPGELNFIHLGRVYQKQTDWSFFLPSWELRMTVNSDQLQKDLSQQGILEDQRFENLVDYLRIQCEECCQSLLQDLPPPQGSEELVDDLIKSLYYSDHQKVAIAYQKQIASHYALKPESVLKGRAQYRLALMQESAGVVELNSKSKFARANLFRAHSSLEFEPAWSALKAELDFTPRAAELPLKVHDMLKRAYDQAPIQEHCFRWLLEHDTSNPGNSVIRRVDLAGAMKLGGKLHKALGVLNLVLGDWGLPTLRGNPFYHARALELCAEIYAELGQFEQSLEFFGQQLNVLRERHGQYSLSLGLTLEKIATLLDYLGRKKQAREYRAWSKRLYE